MSIIAQVTSIAEYKNQKQCERIAAALMKMGYLEQEIFELALFEQFPALKAANDLTVNEDNH